MILNLRHVPQQICDPLAGSTTLAPCNGENSANSNVAITRGTTRLLPNYYQTTESTKSTESTESTEITESTKSTKST